ncbi:MAG TPA: trypsin-like peptidase domain-containing protein, partial [Gemmatimonadaceae bacterium]|nr:trypsin-like peptidase domain-containing protein [Gemmatimonadaceae bacterium]
MFAFVFVGSASRVEAQQSVSTVDPREARGYAFLAAGQYKDALSEFERLKREDPTFAPAWLGMGRAQEGLGRNKIALKSYESYIARQPRDAEGFVAIGWVLERMRRYDAALEAFRDAQKIDRVSADAFRGAGVVLRALGRKQEALRSLREAARLDGRDAATWGQLATLSLEMDRDLEAASYWEEALRRDPGYFDSRSDEREKWEHVTDIIGPRPLRDGAALASAPTEPEAQETAARAIAPSEGAAPDERKGGEPTADDTGAIGGIPVRPGGPSSSGSGFVVSRDRGFVLTNKHVVRGCSVLKVRADGGQPRPATVHALDPDDDLALLELPLPAGPTATFRDDPAVRPGDDIVAVGFPLAGLLADQVNVSTGSVNALAGLYNDLHLLQMSA